MHKEEGGLQQLAALLLRKHRDGQTESDIAFTDLYLVADNFCRLGFILRPVPLA
jgi:hypothetical protein